MAHRLYDIRRELNGSWTVFNAVSTLPVAENGTLLHDLSYDDARELAYLFNHCSIKWRRGIFLSRHATKRDRFSK